MTVKLNLEYARNQYLRRFQDPWLQLRLRLRLRLRFQLQLLLLLLLLLRKNTFRRDVLMPITLSIACSEQRKYQSPVIYWVTLSCEIICGVSQLN